MGALSVTIIAKNEAACIADCVTHAALISTDIIVGDSGSKDDTVKLAMQAGAQVLSVPWNGYGATRNNVAAPALHNWILSLDADELVTAELAAAINAIVLAEPAVVYGFKRANFLGNKRIRYGEWGRDKVYRLYNRQVTQWNTALVHETIDTTGMKKQLLPGCLLHYTMKNLDEYREKSQHYALLSAKKYLAEGKRAGLVKRFLAPLFSFVQNYFFRLGFLDGSAGFGIALVSSHYVYLKYKLLRDLVQENAKKQL